MFMNCILFSLTLSFSQNQIIIKDSRTCSSDLTINNPHCLIFSSEDGTIECVAPNAIEILPSYSEFSVNISCSSSYRLDTTVSFEDRIPSNIYSRIEFNVGELDSVHSSYHLQVHLDFPSGKKRGAIYSIFPVSNKELQTIIISRARKSQWYTGNDFWTTNSLKIEVDNEIVTIPCHPAFSDFENGLLKFDDEAYDSRFPIKPYIPMFDNVSVTYDHAKGYVLNTSLFLSLQSKNFTGEYKCGSILRDVVISLPPEFSVLPNKEMISLPLGPDREGTNSLNLSCTSLHPIILSGSLELISNSEKFVQFINITKNVVTQKPVLQYTARYTNNSVPDWVQGNISCLTADTNRVLHIWTINKIYVKRLDIVKEISQQESKKELKCFPPGNYISVGEDGQKVSLFTLYCTTILQCKMLETCIDFYVMLKADINQYNVRENNGTRIKSFPEKDASICNVKIFQGSMCLSFTDHTLVNRCETISALDKGIAKCVNSDLRMDESVSTIYFTGFDNEFYREVDFTNVSVDAILKIEGPPLDTLYTFNELTFKCEAHSFFSGGLLRSNLILGNKSLESVDNANVVQKKPFMDATTRNPVILTTFIFFNSNVQGIKCSAPILNEIDTNIRWIEKIYYFEIINSVKPVINNEDNSVSFYENVADQILTCKTYGYPIPKLKWLKDGMDINSSLIVINNVISSILQFPKYNRSFEGDYVCSSTNVAGNTSHTFTVSTAVSSKGLGSIGITILLLVLVILTATLVYLYFRLRNAKKTITRLSDEDIKKFKEGLSEMEVNDIPDGTSGSQLPYNDDYEIAKDDIVIDKTKILGSGAFGVVYKGVIRNTSTVVAVKATKPDCSLDFFKSLLSELKILIYVGKHDNIINLIGANTEELQYGKVYIALELCALGSLESYLRKNRDLFSEDNEQYVNCKTTKGHGHPTLLKWCGQIAHGMEFLASKNVVHSDLATRNILITDKQVMKITDFGLSRRMYNYCNYVKSSQDPLPWRWMALESLKSMTFSTQSDVWSYGITLYEIFSMGNIPYPGISYTVQFYQMLDQGTRNPKPLHANSQIYNVMMSCWAKNPRDRPSFDSLRKFFLEKLDQVNMFDRDSSQEIDDSGHCEGLYSQL